MENKTHHVYGAWVNYGWGTMECEEFEAGGQKMIHYLNFNPEWESNRDVKTFWKNRSQILALKNMTVWKYTKLLLQGIRLYLRGKLANY